MKYFIHLSYKGTHYRGWQTQASVNSVQETIEKAISKMLGVHTTIHGCGRTDAQVHASSYYAHVNMDQSFDYDPVFRLNKMLPKDIRIHQWIPVDSSANAQRSAVARTYIYRFNGLENPFVYDLSWYLEGLRKLDFEAISQACKFIEDNDDYHVLCRQPNAHPSTDCYVEKAVFVYDPVEDKATFTITANRFLKSMIRVLVMRLIEIGEHHLSVEEFIDHVTNRVPFNPLTLAPPQGLYLAKVKYNFELQAPDYQVK